MSLQYRIDKFLKKIGAYTISDEDIEIAELYRSLPRIERRLIDLVDGVDLSMEEAARRLGLTPEAAWSLYEEVHDRLDRDILSYQNSHPVS